MDALSEASRIGMTPVAPLARSAWLVDRLQCPRCGHQGFAATGQALACLACSYQTGLRGRIADFSGEVLEDEVGVRTRASFGYEWTEFSDWRPSGDENCRDYFTGFDLRSLAGKIVLDAGCGMGRHARFVAPHAQHLLAVDFSAAIDQAARNLDELPNVALLRADLQNLPLADESFDFIYSFGVLHHIEDTVGTVRRLVRKLRPGGSLRIYLYWRRDGWVGGLLALVTQVRRVTTRLPFGVLKALCWILSVALSAAVIWPYRLLAAARIPGVESLPLFVYTKYPFRVLYNDQFDRFSAPLEKRYTAEETRVLLQQAGLTDISVIGKYGWIGQGRKPA
jgi:SAM-dependent methyltransferase